MYDWADIDTPEHQGYSMKKIPAPTAIPLYQGKDSNGHCLFIIELSGDHTDLFEQQHIPVRGIKSELQSIDANNSQRMVITLEKHNDQGLFSAMCLTLIASLSEVTCSAKALSVTLDQLKGWKAPMTVKKMLSDELENYDLLEGDPILSVCLII